MDKKKMKEDMLRMLKEKDFPESIINAFRNVDRELFVPINLKEQAYKNTALPIGHEQTISQPYTIAFMLLLAEIENNKKILEIGSGSGYVLALTSEMNPDGEIIGIERIKELADESEERLKGRENVKVVNDDILSYLKDERYDRIISSAAFSEMPQKIINKNLDLGGTLVAPVGNKIIAAHKNADGVKIKEYPGFAFVPVIGGVNGR